MEVFLRCNNLEPEKVKKLAEMFGFNLVDDGPIRTKVSSDLTKNDFSEESIWHVDRDTLKVTEDGSVFSSKDSDIPLAKLDRRLVVLYGHVYCVDLMILDLNCCRQASS